jgi:tetratricopeptide (TPR) repeat protein
MLRRRRRCRAALIAALSAWLWLFPASSLAEPPAAHPPAAAAAAVGKKADPKSLEALLKQGRETLAAAEYKAARDAFSDAAAIETRNVEALHGEGLAYMYLNDFAHALAPMERALAANPQATRALVLNMAVCQIGNKNPMRAATLVMDFLTAHPAPLDEPMLNAMGTALSLADDQAKKGRKFAECEAFYKSYNQKLEAAKPGYKRWGVAWMKDTVVNERNANNAASEKTLNGVGKDLDSLDAKIAHQSREVESTKDLFRRGFRSQLELNEAIAVLKTLTDEQEEKLKTREETISKMERPMFPRTMALVGMDDLKAPGVGAGAVVEEVAVATPPPSPTPTPPKPVGPRPAVRPRTDTGAKHTDPEPPAAPMIQVAAAKAPAVHQKVRISSYAAAFPVSDTLVLTAAAALHDASEIQLQATDGSPIEAKLVRADETSGLALLRVEKRKLIGLPIAQAFAGGSVQCAAFPTVNIFNPAAEPIAGTAKPAAANGGEWKVALTRHPRLGGSPLLAANKVVGVELASRESEAAQIPAATLDQVKAFLGSDLPAAGSAGPEPCGVMLQLIATRETSGV